MEIVVSLLCLCTLFVPTLLGVGISYVLEKWVGLWAYAIGWAVPVIAVGLIYGMYDIALRVIPCIPADALACGQPITSAFVFLVSLLCVIVFANFFAQLALYLFLYARDAAKQTPPLEPSESTAPQ